MNKNGNPATLVPPARVFLFCAVGYVGLIFGLWTLYVSALFPSVDNLTPVILRIFLNEFIRVLVFVVPVFIFLKFVLGENAIAFLKLDANLKTGIFWGIFASVLYSAMVIGRIILADGSFMPQPVPIQAWFTSITVAALIEEIAFRGFLLRIFKGSTRFWIANLLTAVLFVAIHFPGWILVGNSSLLPDKLIPMAEIFFLGILLGFLFDRARSLWACVILHATNNLLSSMIFG